MNNKTKFILTYVAGIVTGVVLTFTVGFLVTKLQARSSSDEIVMFDKPRGVVPGDIFEVIQVMPDGSALATGCSFLSDNYGTIVLFIGDESTSYYDNQKIFVPAGKVLKQVGTYSYMARNEMYKTVPIVKIMAKRME